jgi:ectoine hydroxylase
MFVVGLMSRFKQFKFTHWIYNTLHYKSLKHNRTAYKSYHLKKPLIASLSSKDFPDKESKAWLDVGHSRELLPSKDSFSHFPAIIREQLLSWSENGFIILKNYFSETVTDQISDEIDRLVLQKKINPTHDNKLMFANHISEAIRKVTYDRSLIDLLSFILDKEVVPFQTINFIYGSNQRAHSDSIHMTTYPLGYLIAVWIALEDTNMDNGPLFYYPGSHRLPYLLNNDFNEGETSLTLGKKDYRDYEDRLEDVIREKNLERKIFIANKGDVFIWHANLIHGGMPVMNKTLTRKSMVIHYFARNVIKYHEITERPALLRED